MRKVKELATPMAGLLAAAALVPGLLLLTPPAARAAGEAPGKEIFLAQKCNTCHTIDSQKIARTSTSDKMKGPDLSNVGGEHLAPWIAQWLKKEVAATDGKKHMPTWKGTDAEMKTLTDWLSTLKKS